MLAKMMPSAPHLFGSMPYLNIGIPPQQDFDPMIEA
jgi:hypothetical protein